MRHNDTVLSSVVWNLSRMSEHKKYDAVFMKCLNLPKYIEFVDTSVPIDVLDLLNRNKSFPNALNQLAMLKNDYSTAITAISEIEMQAIQFNSSPFSQEEKLKALKGVIIKSKREVLRAYCRLKHIRGLTLKVLESLGGEYSEVPKDTFLDLEDCEDRLLKEISEGFKEGSG